MKKNLRFVGLDAQKDSIAVAVATVSEGLELIQEWLAKRRQLRMAATKRRWLKIVLAAIVVAFLAALLLPAMQPGRGTDCHIRSEPEAA